MTDEERWKASARRWLREEVRFYGRRAPWTRWLHRAIHTPGLRGKWEWDDLDWTYRLWLETKD